MNKFLFKIVIAFVAIAVVAWFPSAESLATWLDGITRAVFPPRIAAGSNTSHPDSIARGSYGPAEQ